MKVDTEGMLPDYRAMRLMVEKTQAFGGGERGTLRAIDYAQADQLRRMAVQCLGSLVAFLGKGDVGAVTYMVGQDGYIESYLDAGLAIVARLPARNYHVLVRQQDPDGQMRVLDPLAESEPNTLAGVVPPIYRFLRHDRTPALFRLLECTVGSADNPCSLRAEGKVPLFPVEWCEACRAREIELPAVVAAMLLAMNTEAP